MVSGRSFHHPGSTTYNNPPYRPPDGSALHNGSGFGKYCYALLQVVCQLPAVREPDRHSEIQLMNKTESWRDTVELMGIVAIVLSLILVAYELRQNTTMMRAQTRDAMTEKQMMFTDWVATNRYTAEVLTLSGQGKLEPGTPESISFEFFAQGVIREWENSYYQFEQGLFDSDEFAPRKIRWRQIMSLGPMRDYWERSKNQFSPRFRLEIDGIIHQIDSDSNEE